MKRWKQQLKIKNQDFQCEQFFFVWNLISQFSDSELEITRPCLKHFFWPFSGFLFVFVIAVLTHQAASVPGFGQCPLVTPVQNFDVANYLGHWYEIRSYRNVFEIGTSCVTADYGMNADGSISVVNRYKRFGQYWDVSGTATIPQAGQGALIVNFTGLQSTCW